MRDLSERLKGTPNWLNFKTSVESFSVISRLSAIQTPANSYSFQNVTKTFKEHFHTSKIFFSSYSYNKKWNQLVNNRSKWWKRPCQTYNAGITKTPTSLSNPFVIATTVPALSNLQGVTTAVLSVHVQEVFHRRGITHSINSLFLHSSITLFFSC